MMHFLKGGNWQDGVCVDFLGFTKQENQTLMVEEVDGLSDRQMKIVLGKTGWTKNKYIFAEGCGYDDRKLEEPEVDCVKEGLWVW